MHTPSSECQQFRPDGVIYAPLWRRLAATLYDMIAIVAIWFCLSFAIVGFRNFRAIEPHTLWFNSVLLLSAMLYLSWSWHKGGQTLGMRAWRIRLHNKSGQNLGWFACVLRFWISLISIGALGLGVVWILFDRHRRTWHDLACASEVTVIKTSK